MERSRDHDLLIKLSEQMVDLKDQMVDFKVCLTKIDKKVDQQNLNCQQRLYNCGLALDNKLNTSWFKWIMGFLIAIVLSIATVSTTTRMDLKDLSHELAVHKVAAQSEHGH